MVTSVMGILNITPDSFSDGGKHNVDRMDEILRTVESMIADGADIIDVGGESTRPDAVLVNADEESERVIPVIENIRDRFDITVSVDTYKASVARQSVGAGASIINDIGMGQKDTDMFETAAELGCKYVLVHNNKNYVNLIDDMHLSIAKALKAGIKKDNLILDPGIGFNKTYEQNIAEFKNIPKLCKLGYPILIGVSNKSMIGNTLELPVGQRLEGTIATSVMAVMMGAGYIRVHDVRANVRAIKMAEAILY